MSKQDGSVGRKWTTLATISSLADVMVELNPVTKLETASATFYTKYAKLSNSSAATP